MDNEIMLAKKEEILNELKTISGNQQQVKIDLEEYITLRQLSNDYAMILKLIKENTEINPYSENLRLKSDGAEKLYNFLMLTGVVDANDYEKESEE